MKIEVHLCVDKLCNHFDVDVYRDAEINKVDIVLDIDEAIRKARKDILKHKQEYYQHDSFMASISKRWTGSADGWPTPHHCVNCGTENK